jgi:hypothetical protein
MVNGACTYLEQIDSSSSSRNVTTLLGLYKSSKLIFTTIIIFWPEGTQWSQDKCAWHSIADFNQIDG